MKIKNIIKDIISAFLYGIAIGGAILLFLIIVSLFKDNFVILKMLNTIRSGFLIVVGLNLFIVAALLLFKKDKVSLKNSDKWKEKFKSLNYVGVLLIISFTIILYSVVFDYLIFIIK